MALFELTELASLVQGDLDTATATLARTIATGLVKGYTRQNLEATTYTDQTLRVDTDRWTIDLPQRPVTAVTAVKVDGALITGWEWNPGRSRVQLTSVPNIATVEAIVEVTYTAGYTVIPDDIKGVALNVARRQYVNPHGIRSSSIDDYSETLAGGDADLAGLSLLPGEMAILDRYRPNRSGSLPIGARP